MPRKELGICDRVIEVDDARPAPLRGIFDSAGSSTTLNKYWDPIPYVKEPGLCGFAIALSLG
jgi:hypothetical protein